MTTTTSNPTAMLADSLAQFSKSAYTAFTEIENQARLEVTRAVAEAREARTEREKAGRELHAATLEAQGWKQEAAANKAAVAQAELTIAHQAETLAAQLETVAQLRREVIQWKDQSRNWQEHFLRVEQERCAQSSRIDELVVEKLQYIHPNSPTRPSLYTPKTKYITSATHTHTITSAPSSTTTKRNSIPSPTQPPSYKSAVPMRERDSSADTPPITTSSAPTTTKKPLKTSARSQRDRDREDPFVTDTAHASASAAKRPRKGPKPTPTANAHASGSEHKQAPHPHAPTPASAPRTTVIRRVRAVINVKQESSDNDDGSADLSTGVDAGGLQTKEESLGMAVDDFLTTTNGTKRTSRRRSRRVVEDEDEDDEDDNEIDSGSDDGHARGGGPSWETRLPLLRHRNKTVNYREEEAEEEDEEEDELMMGAGDNLGEVRHLSAGAPMKKKRKIGAR